MRTLLLSAVMVSFVFLSSANTKLYTKLSKLYQNDREKCMEQVKKVIAKNKAASIPYYFASVIYYDKSTEAQTVMGIYQQLYRSATSASKFEKYSTEDDQNLVNWQEHTASLVARSERVIKALNKQNLGEYSEKLIAQLSKVESIAHRFQPSERGIDQLAELEQKSNQTKLSPSFSPVEGQFYGLPKGKELVGSSNVNFELEVLRLVNEARYNVGLPALTWNESLANASRYHAFDQASQGYISHNSKDLIDGNLIDVAKAMERIQQFYTRGTAVGECIAAGKKTPQEVFTEWKNSSSHAEILFDASARYIGIGFIQHEGSTYTNYWVLTTGK